MSSPNVAMTPRPKIFCVGPNKTGTTAISRFLSANGVRSMTMGGPFRAHNLAHRLLRNIAADRPVLHGLEHIEAFSDLNWMEPRYFLNEALFFPRLVEEYPDAYFVYNTRDLEEWIESRRRHHNGRFLNNFMRCFHVDEATAVSMWRDYHYSYRERVHQTLNKINGNLLEFNITSDGPEKLVQYLCNDYELDSAHWRHERDSSIDSPRKRWRRLLARFSWSEPKLSRFRHR